MMMNRFTSLLLSYCLLLTFVGSCKKQIVEEPEPNLTNCRIVKEIYQVGWRPQNTSKKETIQVDSKSYDVMFARESTFSYDNQGRIVKEEHKPAPYFTPNIDYTVTYIYTPKAVYRRSLSARWDERDTTQLNEKGQALTNADGLVTHYDNEGYLTYAVSKVGSRRMEWTRDSLKNVVKFQDVHLYEPRTQTVEYDLIKKGLPSKYSFRGKNSPNLPLNWNFYVDRSSAFPIGLLFTIKNFYEFDKYERVSREIAIEKHFVPPQQYGQYIYAGGIGVTDYQYNCP